MAVKIKLSIPDFIKEIFIKDSKNYGVTIGKLYNIMFDKFYQSYNYYPFSIIPNGVNIQFSLNKKNSDRYKKKFSKKIEEKRSDFIRSLLYSYVETKPYIRERWIFEKNFNVIKGGIKNRSTLKLITKDGIDIVEPLLIKVDYLKLYNYFFCYSHNMESLYIYILKDIENITYLEKNFTKYKSFKKKEIQNSFDDYKTDLIKIKLTRRGVRFLTVLYSKDRPLIINKDKDIFSIFGNSEKVENYFEQFSNEIKILK